MLWQFDCWSKGLLTSVATPVWHTPRVGNEEKITMQRHSENCGPASVSLRSCGLVKHNPPQPKYCSIQKSASSQSHSQCPPDGFLLRPFYRGWLGWWLGWTWDIKVSQNALQTTNSVNGDWENSQQLYFCKVVKFRSCTFVGDSTLYIALEDNMKT